MDVEGRMRWGTCGELGAVMGICVGSLERVRGAQKARNHEGDMKALLLGDGT